MKKTKPALYLFVLTVIFLTSCKKMDSNQNAASYRSSEIQTFLQNQEDSSSIHVAEKIKKIQQDLVDASLTKINTGKNTDAYICTLKDYTIKNKNGYANIFYKVIFELKNEVINKAFIYTIRTNLSEREINNDIESVLKGNSATFSGELITNRLDDIYLLTRVVKNGDISKTIELQVNLEMKGKNSKSANQTSNNFGGGSPHCTDWYEVTTTYYPDGHVEREWEYLYTDCGNCAPTGEPVTVIVADCDTPPPSGGGGSTNNYADSTNPCDNANKLKTDVAYKSRMDSLKSLTNKNYETGYYSVRNANGTYTYTKQQGTANGSSINPNIAVSISSYMHNHYTGLLSVFSGSDIRAMYQWLHAGKLANPSTFTMSLVTASGTVYMMQIDDLEKFQTFGQTYMADDLTFSFFEAQYSGRYHISPTATNSTNLTGFLRMLTEYNTGIKFFVGNSTFTQWNPQAFKSDNTASGGSVVNSPCN